MLDFLRRGRLLLLVAAVAIVAPVKAQTVTAVDLQFNVYHDMLSGTADDLLLRQEQAIKAPAESAPAPPQAAEDQFRRAVERVRQLHPSLGRVLREEGLPMDLSAVVLVESGGRTTALSPKGAFGVWQLMPDTARRYGLTVSNSTDERSDVPKATRAAARYLRDLYAQFGDWQLAFAAYNAGESAVTKAMARANSREFSHLSRFLPNETRAYVPAVMSARLLFETNQAVSAPMMLTAKNAQILYAQARLEQ